MTAAQIITVTIPDGQQVNVWVWEDGTVEANWRPEPDHSLPLTPVEMVGGAVVVDRQAA